MKSNYNQLGQYIEMVSRTNSDLKYGIEDVRGCSNTKQMMQTRANLIGRTYEKFIVLRPQEFVFNRRTTRNGEKIGMAYNNTDREYIFTNDYVAFRVKQEYLDKLLPDYLYMFFCRDEFDRYARYKSTGSATEFFNWEDMCAVPFEIPPMDFQQLVVNAYKVLNERIETKQKINDNLEAQANAIFSSSAPDFTDLQPIHNFGTVITGKTPPTSVAEYYGNDIPFIKTPDMHGNVYITSSECSLSKAGADSQKNKYIPENTVVVACIGANAGEVALTSYIAQTNQQINAIISKYPCFLYFSIKAHTVELRTLGEGSSTMININKTSFENYEIPTPSDNTLQQLEHKLNIIFSAILHNLQEIDRLNETKDLLVTQLSR